MITFNTCYKHRFVFGLDYSRVLPAFIDHGSLDAPDVLPVGSMMRFDGDSFLDPLLAPRVVFRD